MLSLSNLDIQGQYEALSDDVKLIILHPAAHSAHRSFAQILLKEAEVAYVHLPSEADDVTALWTTIAETIENQLGVELGQLPDTHEQVAQALAKALNQVESSILFMEGYDGQAAQKIYKVVMGLVDHLQPAHRVILSGRDMPTELLEHDSNREKLALLPVDDRQMLVDYANPEPGKTILEVRAFGQGQVLVDGRPIDKWEGLLPRALFFFFVDRAMTTRDDIFQTFWPKLSTREATNVFHVTKRKVSEILGTNLTVYGAGFYRIAPEIDLRYDVVNFQQCVQEAQISDDDEAERLYQTAIDLYREDFLTIMDADWVDHRREEMQSTYTEALIGLARIEERKGAFDKALGLYLRATAPSPQREDLARAIMRLYHELGQDDRALETFARLQHLLRNSLGVEPDPLTLELAQKISSDSNISLPG